MTLKRTSFGNIFYVCEGDDLIGVCHDPDREYRRDYFVGDFVEVTDDGRGYICPGISKPGIGMIIGVREDDTDHFFRVMTLEGEVGFCKSARIEVISPKISPEDRAMLEHARNDEIRRDLKKCLRKVS